MTIPKVSKLGTINLLGADVCLKCRRGWLRILNAGDPVQRCLYARHAEVAKSVTNLPSRHIGAWDSSLHSVLSCGSCSRLPGSGLCELRHCKPWTIRAVLTQVAGVLEFRLYSRRRYTFLSLRDFLLKALLAGEGHD